MSVILNDHLLPIDESPFKLTPTLELLAFPDELLLLILIHVPPRSLYTLATLCTKLHYMALPVYFQLCGLTISDGTLNLTPENLDALPGLRIGLFAVPQPIRRIECVFPRGEDAFLACVRRLRAVVARLVDTEEVELNFSLIEEMGLRGCLEPRAWSEPLESLLETVIASGCTKLKVKGDLVCPEWLHWLSPPPPPPPSPLTAHRVTVKPGLSTRIAKKFASIGRKRRPRTILAEFPPVETPDAEPSPSIIDAPVSNLQELTITSAMLIHGLLPDWTLRTFNTSTHLTTLSLLNVPFAPHAIHVFTHIHIPSLAHLTIKSCPIDFPTLSVLLARHAGTLTALTIDRLLEHPYPSSAHAQTQRQREIGWTPIRCDIELPFVTYLCAPARYIPQFLTWRCVLPSLAALTVLAGAPRALILYEFALVPWHLLDYVKDRVDECELTLDVDVALWDNDGEGVLCTADPTSARERYIRRVRRLVVRLGTEDVKKRVWERLRMWLECFEDVEDVVFVLDGPEDGGKSCWEGAGKTGGVSEGGLTLRDEKVRRAFLYELMPFFARVPRVRIGGYDLW